MTNEDRIREILEKLYLCVGSDGNKRVDSALSQILALTNLPKDFCDVCWTSSWMTVPKETLNAQKVIGKDEWVLCQMCEADKKLTTKIELNEGEVLAIIQKVKLCTKYTLQEQIAKDICSHFSKPKIKYPEKLEGDAHYTKNGDEVEPISYNQAIDDMRLLNEDFNYRYR